MLCRGKASACQGFSIVIYYYCVCMCVDGVGDMAPHRFGGQKTTLWSQFSPFTFMWVLGIKQGYEAGAFASCQSFLLCVES